MAPDIIMLMCHICDVSYQPSYEIYSVADCFSSSVCVCVLLQCDLFSFPPEGRMWEVVWNKVLH